MKILEYTPNHFDVIVSIKVLEKLKHILCYKTLLSKLLVYESYHGRSLNSYMRQPLDTFAIYYKVF